MEQNSPSTATIDKLRVEQWEERASTVVLAIQKCMESLRNVKEFASLTPAALWTAVKHSKISSVIPDNQSKNIDAVIAETDLYSKLVNDGILSEVLACCQHDNGSSNSNCCQTKDSGPRTRLSHEIMLPLANALCDCYDYLDRIPTPTETPEPLSQRKSKSKQPPPPAGMLSLQNYTDIGSFTEFWVCTSILPFLEPYVLFSVEDRARYFLPKSLSGRISKPSLLWGCRQERESQKGSSVGFLQKAVQELQNTVLVLGHLLLLDRFRPMLLPRHLADLYAAMFQAESYLARTRQLSKNSGTVDGNRSGAKDLDLSPEFTDIMALLLPNDTDDHSSANPRRNGVESTSTNSLAPVDPGLKAQALQTLLLQGTKSPVWLRRRVSKQLTDMACQNLSVIVQVFVHAAPPKDKTAASARLARTLISPRQGYSESSGYDKEQSIFYDFLCQQLIKLLDICVDESLQQSMDTKKGELTSKQTLNIHTVWNIMDQLPPSEMHQRMLHLLSAGMVENGSNGYGSTTIHRSVKRIGALLSSMPPSFNPSKVSQLFLLPLHEKELFASGAEQLEGTKSTMLGVMIRLASVSPSILKSDFHDDTVWVSRMILHILMDSRYTTVLGDGKDAGQSEQGTRTGVHPQVASAVEVAAMALVYSLAPSNWDLSGRTYVLGPDSTNVSPPSQSKLDFVLVKHQESAIQNVQDLVSTIEKRVEMVLKDLVTAFLQNHAMQAEGELSDGGETSEDKGGNLPSCIFHFVLLLYFTAITSQNQNSSNLPAIFCQPGNELIHDYFRVVAMCTLPRLCEQYPPDSLLMGASDGGFGIFKVMQLVFTCAASYFTSEKALVDPFIESGAEAREEYLTSHAGKASHGSFGISGKFLSQILLGPTDAQMCCAEADYALETQEHKAIYVDSSDAEMFMSVTSLLLSLLIAILELGTEMRRLDAEEAIFGSYLLVLQPLAEASDLSWMQRVDDESHGSKQELSVSCSEMAEMAAHAMALVEARKASRTGRGVDQDLPADATTVQTTREDRLWQTFEEAEQDLKSTQPPIRARGVVSLQRMLRGDFLQRLPAREVASSSQKKLIMEVGEDESQKVLLVDKAIAEALRISVLALSDTESYVYLAAIQTVVAAADLHPSKALPLVGLALVSGALKTDEGGNIDEGLLTPEQRIKLAEALMFCIRRRARIDEFIPVLMDIMIFGHARETGRAASAQSNSNTVDLMQQETQDYFLLRESNRVDSPEDEVEDLEERAEKQNLRFNTGGPLFRSEETDVVTAARITVVSELVTAAHPTILSKYCAVVVRIATQSLRLDASRPVRRAAAFLAREVYRSLLREHDAVLEALAGSTGDDEFSADLALATALVSTNHDEVLAATLRRCLSANDLGDISESNYRVFDAATAARCQEALDARQDVVDGGLFGVAKMVAESKELQSSKPVSRLVRELLHQGGRDTVKAMKGLKIDTETLEFK